MKAGPKRFTAGESSALKAWRFVFTLLALLPLFNRDRGVKKRRNDLGVTVGGFLGLRPPPASDATEGGEDGISWDEGGKMGSERGGSGNPETRAIVLSEETRKGWESRMTTLEWKRFDRRGKMGSGSWS